MLGRFDLALAEAAAGQGSLVLIYSRATGMRREARLCRSGQAGHRASGGPALLGRAAPGESGIEFGTLAEALRLARRSAPQLWNAAAARADILGAIAPELTRLAAAGPSRAADRPVVFEALLNAVEEAAPGDRATLWVLDDVHWADDATWHFVRYAAADRRHEPGAGGHLPGRGDGPGRPARWPGLVQLKRHPRVLTTRVRRLTPAHASQLVRALAPALPSGVAARIIERSAGTPLLIEELASLARGVR